uniref:PITH domain-containing protein n=1 Tax=Ascaris lumbricoides TaxID=6252 RepID=A0A0M3I2C9_ASCLU
MASTARNHGFSADSEGSVRQISSVIRGAAGTEKSEGFKPLGKFGPNVFMEGLENVRFIFEKQKLVTRSYGEDGFADTALVRWCSNNTAPLKVAFPDLAILELESPLDLSDPSIRAICLANPSKQIPDHHCLFEFGETVRQNAHEDCSKATSVDRIDCRRPGSQYTLMVVKLNWPFRLFDRRSSIESTTSSAVLLIEQLLPSRFSQTFVLTQALKLGN